MLNKIFKKILLQISLFGCYLNSPIITAIAWRLRFFKDIEDNPNSNKILIVLYKSGGIHDVRSALHKNTKLNLLYIKR